LQLATNYTVKTKFRLSKKEKFHTLAKVQNPRYFLSLRHQDLLSEMLFNMQLRGIVEKETAKSNLIGWLISLSTFY